MKIDKNDHKNNNYLKILKIMQIKKLDIFKKK